MKTKEVYNQLLLTTNPALKYRVFTELLDLSFDLPEIKKLHDEISKMKDVEGIFHSMHPDGYWLQKKPRTGVVWGAGVEYGAFATTHFILAYLSELGFTKENPVVAKASDRYLNLIKPDGDWWNHMSCLNGLNIRTFINLGYKNDERLRKVIDLMLNTSRKDNGYLCDMHEKRKKNKKSCYRGCLKMLLAFSELPELYEHKRVKSLIEYFLNRNVIYNSKFTKYVNSDIERFSFPVIWRGNTWEAVFALSKMGFGRDERLKPAWQLIEKRRNPEGTYNLDWSPIQCPVNFGNRSKPNEWITFYIELSKKYADFQ